MSEKEPLIGSGSSVNNNDGGGDVIADMPRRRTSRAPSYFKPRRTTSQASLQAAAASINDDSSGQIRRTATYGSISGAPRRTSTRGSIGSGDGGARPSRTSTMGSLFGTRERKMSEADFMAEDAWHRMSPALCAQRMRCDLNLDDPRYSGGLPTAVVDEKHVDGFWNAVTPPPKKSEILKYLEKFTDWLMILEMAVSVLCFVVYGLGHDRNNLYIACLLIVLVFLTCTFSYLQERTTDKVMETFGNMMASVANVIRDGEHLEIDAADLVPGDLVVLRAGDKTPADLRMVSVNGIKVDNSSLTGESEPVQSCVDCTNSTAALSRNMVWSSTLVIEGSGFGIVINVGDDTMIGAVAILAGTTVQQKSILEMEILHFVRVSTAISIFLAIFLISVGLGRDFPKLDVIIAAISILLANVPQGLPPAVTSVLALTAEALRHRNVFVKRLDIVETLGSCTVIASDKTGTLTLNRMTAVHTWPTRSPVGPSYSDDEYEQVGSFRHLARVLILCNRITVGEEMQTLEDLEEVRLNADASEQGLFKRAFVMPNYREVINDYPNVAEIPFNSVHKWQLSVHTLPANESKNFAKAIPKEATAKAGNGEVEYLAALKGAPEIVLGKCKYYYTETGELGVVDEDYKEFVNQQITAYASHGERVLGFSEAYINAAQLDVIEDTRELPDDFSETLVFSGLCTLWDPPKDGVAEAVVKCKTAGIQVIMITGDFPITAAAIAEKVGIFDDGMGETEEQGVYTGKQVLTLKTDEEWDRILDKPRLVFARMLPENKLTIVEQLQRRGEVVAVTGDGVNDSPALKRADVGIAMGIAGTEVAKEAAKIICADDNFASIVEGIRYGRIIFDNLRKTIMLVVTHLIPEAWPFIFAYVLEIPLGLSALMLLTIDLGTEMMPSIALAYEGPEADIMVQPPRSLKTDRLVSVPTLTHAYLEVGMLESALCYLGYLGVFYYHGVPLNMLLNSTQYFVVGAPDITSTHVENGQHKIINDHKQVQILKEVQTLWFASIAFMQFFHVLSVRAIRQPFWTVDRNTRLYLSVCFSVCIVMLVVFTPGVTTVFLSRAFPPIFWAYVMGCGLVVMGYVELKKAILRTFCPRKTPGVDEILN